MTLRRRLAFVTFTICTACSSPTPPTAPAVVVQSLQVGGSGTLDAGESRQLSALAVRSDGSSSDVTTAATWQSSAPSIVSVSAAGRITAVAEGTADISATYNGVRGSIPAAVRPSCSVSVSPATASFTAFGGTAGATVTVDSPSCRWSVRSDAPWWPFRFEPSASGSGTFTYTVPPNSTTSPRTATLVVETSTARAASLTIGQDRPLGCSYVTQPDELTFTAAGGTGQFNVITTPGDCQWNLINGLESLGVTITSGFSGTGNRLVRYSVQAHTRNVDADGYLEIAGLSGVNPNGRHHVVILKR